MSAEESTARKAYTTPELRVYGDINTLTQNSDTAGTVVDSNYGPLENLKTI